MQRFDFKINIIAIKLFLVMILNLYLTRFKSDFEVAVLQRGHRMPIFHKLVWFFRVILKWSRWACKRTQRLISVHFSLHANELCSPRSSLLWKSKGDLQIIIKIYKVGDLLLLEVQLDHEQWLLIHPLVLTFKQNLPWIVSHSESRSKMICTVRHKLI